MKVTPAQVIAQSIRFDRDVSGNADRILAALLTAGFAVVPLPSLPETARMFSGERP